MITSDPTVIARAVDMGINYFDTSRNYQGGQNERMVGAALGARRKDIFLASKSRQPSTGPGILAEIDTSLKELGTDHLDVWHLHGKAIRRRSPTSWWRRSARPNSRARFGSSA